MRLNVVRSHGRKVWANTSTRIQGDARKHTTRKKPSDYNDEVSEALSKVKRPWQDTAEVLRRFSESTRTARRLYQKFVAA
jgi:hypothetical protein